MTTKQIEIYLEVALTGSFTMAAERLFVSQPTVSRQMALLEEEIGYSLFVRGNNNVHLTPEGEVLKKTFEKLNQILDRGIREIKSISDGHQGHLALGFISDICVPDFFLHVLDVFQKKYPWVDISFVGKPYTDFATDLEDGAIDVLLAHEMELSRTEKLHSMFVGEVDTYLYYGIRNPLAGKRDLKIEDFMEQTNWSPLAANTESQRRHLKDISDRYNLPEFKTEYTESTNSVLFHIRMGDGFAIMDPFVVQSIPNDVLKLGFPDDSCKIEQSLFWGKENINPCVRLFCECMKAHVG